jgi:release factor glutamine methyltransferase
MTAVLATVRERLDRAVDRLAGAGVEAPRADAEWLLAAALGVPRSRLHVGDVPAPDGTTLDRYEAWVRRRARREPLQHILGTQAFRDLTLRVGPQVLVPRPETELLVAWALELLGEPGRRPLAIDVGTGSGCIACALAWEHRDVQVVAVDTSRSATVLAGENVAALGLTGRVRVIEGDLFDGVPATGIGQVDLVVSNPPYLPTGLIETLAPEVADHEPRVALDGGPDGLRVVRRLVAEAPRWLRPGAPLVLETSGAWQAAAVAEAMRAAGLADVASRRDLNGIARFVCGRRAAGGA